MTFDEFLKMALFVSAATLAGLLFIVALLIRCFG